ncbi:MAG: 30S ribosomal protein S9 [Candidatus Eisenbacteria bacterium]|nr:30S ribosomal protein S9 [Candidatus Eisenbacteria bacterium]
MAQTVINATGRRKSAVARVRLVPGSGSLLVNARPFEEYFPREPIRRVALRPLEVTESLGKYDVHANIRGGGLSGQAGAFSLGVARALKELDPALKAALSAEGLLTRDAREKERKKYGQPGARKRFQFSKR